MGSREDTFPQSHKIISVDPESRVQGEALDVIIYGRKTNSVPLVSQACFGEGIAVNFTTVARTDVEIENIIIDPDAEVGVRDVIVRTRDEAAIGEGLFTVVGRPKIIVQRIAIVTSNDGKDRLKR